MSVRTNLRAISLFGALAGIAAAEPGGDGSLVRLSVTEGSASFVASDRTSWLLLIWAEVYHSHFSN